MMVAIPAISVIVCCYNAAKTLPDTLDSLNAQTFLDFEILAIDDGSTDDTVATLRDYAASEPRLRVLENPRNRGTAFSRQRGLEMAHAPLVIFFDADDLADRNLLATLHRKLLSDDAMMGVSCVAEYFNDKGSLGFQKVGASSRDEFMRFFNHNKLYFQSVVTLFHRDLGLRVGGFRTDVMPNAAGIRYEDFAEDLDLWCRMSDLGAEGRYFLNVPESLFRYRKPLDSLSTSNLHYMQLKIRWIKDCLRRRRAGEAERSLAEFMASRSAVQRVADWRSDKAAAFYKRAGFAYARRNFAGLAWYLLLTGLMSPKLIRQKIASQKVKR